MINTAENINYQVKNLLLTYPADWYIQKDTFEAVKDSIQPIVNFYEDSGLQPRKDTKLDKIIQEPLKDVYTVPFFSEKFCNILLDEMQSLETHFGFNPNPEEDNLRQIPEITFQDNCPQIFQSLMQTIYTIGNPIFLNIWNRHVDSGGIQIANYNLKDKKQGAWHHDASADISMVVPLNTGKYKGGGTEFLKRGTVEPLPTGHALIFPSFTHMHRGLAVESGDRYLLVFWLKCLQE
jgi:hypothetical protein|tara:strand:- start:1295 stop:2002 length:708 start_codon:yes stop_codon:yes gene_type:complete